MGEVLEQIIGSLVFGLIVLILLVITQGIGWVIDNFKIALVIFFIASLIVFMIIGSSSNKSYEKKVNEEEYEEEYEEEEEVDEEYSEPNPFAVVYSRERVYPKRVFRRR